ncbi:hypothetical protein RB195_009746 [Necator americanus]|uniref:Uncharacterized protein n=1 Tax=Necator americanus TaxID=51031 RepID=A0ABR1CY27_NECAM
MSIPKSEDLMEDIATTSSEKLTLADVEKWDAHVLLAVAKQKLRNEKGSKHTYVGHRPNTSSADNSALSLFFVCPGPGFRGDGDYEKFHCRIREMHFSDVIPEETDPVIRDFLISSVFSLACMISIYENETDVDRKRYLMKQSNYNFVTMSGAKKAYTFYKRYCDHMMNALLLHDGSNIAMTVRAKSVDIEISQLNDLANVGIHYALTHSWEECRHEIWPRRTLIFLPCGFRSYSRVLQTATNVKIFIYTELSDIPSELANETRLNYCIFVLPTTDKPCERNEWNALAMAFTHIVRRGAKLVTVCGPRGEAAWEQNRIDALKTMEIIRDAAAAMKTNVVTTFNMIPSVAELFASIGLGCRQSSFLSYPVQSIRAFLTAMQEFVKPHVNADLYTFFEEPISRTKAYKEKKRLLENREGGERRKAKNLAHSQQMDEREQQKQSIMSTSAKSSLRTADSRGRTMHSCWRGKGSSRSRLSRGGGCARMPRGVPRIPDAITEGFHRNGFHAEVVGMVAPHRYECGILILDYASYVNGAIFDETVEPLVSSITANTSMDVDLCRKVCDSGVKEARRAHEVEMRALFDKYRSKTLPYAYQEQVSFPFVGVIALGFGVGLGTIFSEGLHSISRMFFGADDGAFKAAMKEIEAVKGKLNILAAIVETQTCSTRCGLSLAIARSQFLNAVEEAMNDLFNYGKISHRLINHAGRYGLLDSIKQLMGVQFNASLLSRYYSVAGDVLQATVLSMNARVMEVKVCYPVTKVDEIGYALDVVPLGQFSSGTNEESFWWHTLNRWYVVPRSLQINNISALGTVRNGGAECRRIASIAMCSIEEQAVGCQLDQHRRDRCEITRLNSSDPNFTLIRPILRTTVIATRYRHMLYRETPDAEVQSRLIETPVFIVEMPKLATLHIGLHRVQSRVSEGDFLVDVKIVSQNTTFGPFIDVDATDDGRIRLLFHLNEYNRFKKEMEAFRASFDQPVSAASV